MTDAPLHPGTPAPPKDFIRERIDQDNQGGRFGQRVYTRFPPEPNGYLHIGHAKSICLNFGIARDYGGKCNLRMDDTNPTKEDVEYVDAIQDDVRWLGFAWEGAVRYASDYFEEFYRHAETLIQKGKAYVDSLTADQIRAHRGTLTEPGRNSPYRDRPVAENLDLLRRMRKGEFADGAHVLRAKIDMASPNITMRDPAMMRIRKATHHRTGDAWCIYPMYDYAHCISDSIEGITHSLCTLEFENNRPLYDWFLENLELYRPQQIEFARLNVSHTVMSKRKLLELVTTGAVGGWDDPRLPTLMGLRRRGYTPEAIRAFVARGGVSKFDGVIDMSWMEQAIREDLNKRAPRRMAVLHPLKLVIENYPAGQSEGLDAINNPEDASAGTRKVPFARELWIEQEDFREAPPKGYYRLSPGVEVRLRSAYFVKCTSVVKDAAGHVSEVRCTYDPASRGGNSPDGRKVKATIHWVSATHAVDAEVRLYETLFTTADAEQGGDWKQNLNPNALQVLQGCKLEPSLGTAAPEERFQFERVGYFVADRKDCKPGRLVFNRTVGLKDSWAKEEKKQKG